ncbi:MAG: 1-acyl-sn-glycerol-3-phosphate acyltransferase [Candidatus Adiutrix sp.]|jgi:1-acyl-sn-glycerol-3-phosphate acyltransferase|nr:1-acyl-sn-glycerol-3-phosphate acyltransferase [Candidatus Adiutrix sp.]
MKPAAEAARLIAANIWCWGCLAIISIAALAAAPLWLLAGRLRGWSWARGVREGTWLYARLYLASISPFVRLDIRHAHRVADFAPAVWAVNHQSWLDLYLMSAQPVRNICILIRAWPFRRLFFFGPLMRLAGYVPTEGADFGGILEQCRREIADGAAILGYPEGTRSRDGSLGRFHSGLFKLAVELNRPVIPVVVRHSGRIIPKGSFIFRPGRIEISYEAPVEPGQFAGEALPHGGLRRCVRQDFQRVLHDVV